MSLDIDPIGSAPVSATAVAAAWGAPLDLAGCDECDWAALLPPGLAERTCPNCFRSPLAGREEATYGQPPELEIPFAARPDQIAQGLRAFRASIPFAPADLDPRRLTQRLRRICVPMWLVDGGVGASWQAELGYDYDVVSYQDRFNEETGWVSNEVTETRVRWEPRVGRLGRVYQNIPAPALESFELWRERLSDYDLHAAQPYRANLLGDAVVRLPNRSPRDAWYDAARGFRDAAADECRQAAGADHIREFGWSPQFGQLHWTQLLLPAYTTYYLDDEGVVWRVLVHGQTGRASGPRRASMQRARLRALLVLVAAIMLVAAVLILADQLSIQLFADTGNALFGALLLAFVIGHLAIKPLVTVSQFNRKQETEPKIRV
jgi:hypothetical protein